MGGSNAPNVRFSEILLSYAKALNEVGRQTEAMEEVNKIRVRAGLAPKSPILTHD